MTPREAISFVIIDDDDLTDISLRYAGAPCYVVSPGEPLEIAADCAALTE